MLLARSGDEICKRAGRRWPSGNECRGFAAARNVTRPHVDVRSVSAREGRDNALAPAGDRRHRAATELAPVLAFFALRLT
jgi:hypothetical protein